MEWFSCILCNGWKKTRRLIGQRYFAATLASLTSIQYIV